MHRSRLAGFIIDCQTDDLKGAAEFWSSALGMPIQAVPGPEGQLYVGLVDPTGRLDVEVQRVDHPSRVHLDIEADDLEAEVRRLEGIGARRIAKVKGWWVMEAPTGQRFCVVKPKSPDFAAAANEWP
jgi:hypothetical protein